jgi:hypothetical protein
MLQLSNSLVIILKICEVCKEHLVSLGNRERYKYYHFRGEGGTAGKL